MAGSESGGKPTPKFELLIDGAAASPAVVESVIAIRVRLSQDLASCLELRLSNSDLSWTEADTFDEGKRVEVKLGYEETGIEQVFGGEIVRRDCEFPVRGPAVVTVVAFDKQAKLRRERRSRTWLDAKDSDIISALASDAGLSADVKATTTTLPYVVQFNQPNLSFLYERCRRLGYIVTIDEKDAKLTAKPIEDVTADVTLKWGKDLLAFSARMSVASQLTEVSVRGWDMTKKEKIQDKLAASAVKAQFGGSDLGAKLAESTGGKRTSLMASTPIFSLGEATAMAESLMTAAAQTYALAEGTCQGDPKLRPGKALTVEEVGARASGPYLVNEVYHHFQPGLGYSTHFQLNRPTERIPAGDPEPLPESVPAREEGESEAPSFIEFDIRSVSGEDVAGWGYTVTLPNGETRKGKVDASGRIRLEGIRDPGEAKIELEVPEDLDHLG
ncbi:MAG: phage late control D family protein [Planctomycetota bacterium]